MRSFTLFICIDSMNQITIYIMVPFLYTFTTWQNFT